MMNEVYLKAGFPEKHGSAFQEVANKTNRIIVSRCLNPLCIQLLEENYASKGFGIKAKTCNWGPFAGFVLNHFQYCKFKTPVEKYKSQINHLKHSAEVGFQTTDRDTHDPVHIEMSQPDRLLLTEERLRFLNAKGMIRIRPKIQNGASVFCTGPFGPLEFKLSLTITQSSACWAIMHRSAPQTKALYDMALKNQGNQGVDPKESWFKWTYVEGIVNLLPEDRNATDPAKNCVTGDFDLWGVFPEKNAEHGMERQQIIFPALNPNISDNTGGFIKEKYKDLKKSVLESTEERWHVKDVGGKRQVFKYREDPELGNISPLVFDTMNKLNRQIKNTADYRGGRMVHHNDDLGNPFRDDLEEELIAFIPNDKAYFWNKYTYYTEIKKYESAYSIYDNPAIWAKRK